jgi:hypothetical protein
MKASYKHSRLFVQSVGYEKASLANISNVAKQISKSLEKISLSVFPWKVFQDRLKSHICD